MEKTIREWFELLPDNGLRQMAMERTPDRTLSHKYNSLHESLIAAFNWNTAGPDYEFWEGVCHRAKSGFYEAKYGKQSEVLTSVINDLKSREKRGLDKYGTTVDRTDLNLRDWLQHAYEEALDEAMYLKKAITMIDSEQI